MAVEITSPPGDTSTGTYTIGNADIFVTIQLSDPANLTITGTLASYFYDGDAGADQHPILCLDPIGNPPPLGVGTLIFTIDQGDEPLDTQTMTVTVVAVSGGGAARYVALRPKS